jgi:hypothetical protein
MKNLLLGLALLICSASYSQILNAESLRKVTDTSGWSGSASVQFALRGGVNDYIALGTDVHVQYKMKRHLILIKNQLNFEKVDGDRFGNNGIQHIRYNNRFHERWSWEVFAQAQYNKISKIDFRGLTGAGPRFKVTRSEKYKVYMGALIMYEHEEVDDGITPIQRDFRYSSYLSFSFYPKDGMSLISTSYYQPKVGDLADHRFSNESSLSIDIIDNIGFTASYVFIFDAFPAIGVPRSQYQFKTGLTYNFD